VLGEGFQPIATCTTDLERAMSGADVILMTVPTHAHETVAAMVAPHLKEDQVLIAAPGHTALLLPYVLKKAGIERPVLGDMGSLPYICRKQAADTIAISKKTETIAFATFPASERDRLEPVARALYPMLKPVANVLATVFPYTNAIHHPPALLMNAGRVEATGGDYYHYYDGITPAVGRVIDALDAERRAVAAGFGIETKPLAEEFFNRGYTTAAARDSGLAYEVFHQSEPDRWIRAPGTLDHRFLNEDIPFGLVLLSELGAFAGVPTPAIDHMIHLGSMTMQRDYRKQGLTLARMGLAGITMAGMKDLLEHGHGASACV
jgi:opine dehydrogenase